MSNECVQAETEATHGIESLPALSSNDIETLELRAKVVALEARLDTLTHLPQTSESPNQAHNSKKDSNADGCGDLLKIHSCYNSILLTSQSETLAASHEKLALVISKSRPLSSRTRVSKLNSHFGAENSRSLMSELELCQAKCAELEERLGHAEMEAQAAKFEKAKALQALETLEDENAKLQDEIGELLNLVEKQHFQISALESRAARLERDLLGYEGEEAILRQALQQADETVEELYERLHTTEEELTTLRLSVSSTSETCDAPSPSPSLQDDPNRPSVDPDLISPVANGDIAVNKHGGQASDSMQSTVESSTSAPLPPPRGEPLKRHQHHSRGEAEKERRESDKGGANTAAEKSSNVEHSRVVGHHRRRRSMSGLSMNSFLSDSEVDEKGLPSSLYHSRGLQSVSRGSTPITTTNNNGNSNNSSNLVSFKHQNSDGASRSVPQETSALPNSMKTSAAILKLSSQKTAIQNSHGSGVPNHQMPSSVRAIHQRRRSISGPEMANQLTELLEPPPQSQPRPTSNSGPPISQSLNPTQTQNGNHATESNPSPDQQQMLLQKQQELVDLLLEKEKKKMEEKKERFHHNWFIWGSVAIFAIAVALYTFTH